MARRSPNRLVRTITDALWQRDRRRMAVIDRIASAVGRRPRRTVSSGFRKVLCPVDFSGQSRLALKTAAAIARRMRGGELTVMFVNDPLLVAAAATALNDRDFVRTSAIELQRFIAETIPARTRTTLRVATLVSVGQPPGQIVETAVKIGADLIVVGCHGLTGANRVILGSTTQYILRHTSVPVLAMPASSETVDLKSWPKRIAAAIDMDRHSARDVRTAARIARWLRSSLSIVHVVNRVAAPRWFVGDLAVRETQRVAEARDRLTRIVATTRNSGPVPIHVAAGRPQDAIGALAVRAGSRLIVTTLRERDGWLGAPQGSITYHLLTRALLPVLACPPTWHPR